MQSSPRIEELRQKFHENPRRYFAPLANEYRKAGDPEQAIAICRAHLAQQPGHMSGHVVYGQALYDAGRIDEASTVFRQALALDPENMIVLRHLGDIARQRGEVDEARSWYSRALDGDPQDAEVAAYLAELTEPLSVASPEPKAEAEPESAPSLVDETTFEESPVDQPVTAAAPLDDSPYLEEDFGIPDHVHTEARPEPEQVPEPIEFETPQPVMEAEQPVPVEIENRGYRSTPEYESSPIITRTLAELYLEQGYLEPALEIYRQLAEREPHDSELQAKITQLSIGLDQPAPTPEREVHAATTDLMEEAAGAGEVGDSSAMTEESADIETTDLWDTADSWGDGLFEDTADTSDAYRMSEAPQPPTQREQPAQPEDEFFGLPSDEDGFSFMSSFPAHKEDPEPPGAVTPAAEVPAEESDDSEAPQPVAESFASEPEPEPEPEAQSEPEPEREVEAEPEPEHEPQTAGATEPAARGITIREFFATLGSMRPPAINGEDAFTSLEESAAVEEEQPEEISQASQDEREYPYADDAFASLFENAPVSPEDSRAAAALSSAVAHNPPSPVPTPPEQRSANKPDSANPDQGVQESEDDIRRFREWLDGLANS